MTSSRSTKPLAVTASEVQPRPRTTGYPEPFRSRVAGRNRRILGDIFGLKAFGVNLTTLEPGSESALLHRHSKQDEFIYIVSGEAVLATDEGEIIVTAGMCAGFPAAGVAHHLVNRSNADVVYLEIGDRPQDDEGRFPNDDLRADRDEEGRWFFSHKDGTRY